MEDALARRMRETPIYDELWRIYGGSMWVLEYRWDHRGELFADSWEFA